MGILWNKSSTTCNSFFPINDKDKPPIKIINKIVNIISIPGIGKGKYVLGFKLLGINFDDTLIKNLLRYKVKPIGINTTIPVIK